MMISIMARFSKEKVIEYQMCFLIFLRTFFFWNISHSEKNWARHDQKRSLVLL